jgi:chromosome segregation ATPase
MTGEEMERAIEFLLQSQANHEARLGELTVKTNQLTEQIAETNRIVQFHAETQTNFIQIVTRHIEAQVEINASLRAGIARMDARIDQTDVQIKQADVKINQTDVKINQTGANVNRTDARLDRLIRVMS